MSRQENSYALESDAEALSFFLRLSGVAEARAEAARGAGPGRCSPRVLAARAHAAGLRAQVRSTDWAGLAAAPPPALAELRDGGYLVVGRVGDAGVAVVRRAERGPKVELMPRAVFERVWTGRVVLGAPSQDSMPRVARAVAPLRRFGRALVKKCKAFWPASRSEHIAFEAGAAEGDQTGLGAFVLLLGCHGISVDPTQILHRLGAAQVGLVEMLRCARDLGLKASVRRMDWDRLARAPLPGVAALRDGSFIIVGKIADGAALVQRPTAPGPEKITRHELEQLWDGRLLLMARRSALADVTRRFDISWFVGAMHKYRRLLGEVLVASFFLQLFALVSPLFFQVVIDKVLAHRSLSTLDVLIGGLVAVTLAEGVLGALRTYLFTHTTNRIDVELGARLFRHLLALPIAYFQARRVGDSLARVRELENIRQFLTSSALTLVVDLFFTLAFFAVMLNYSPALTGIVLASIPLYIGISVFAAPLFRQRLDEKFRRGSENHAFLVECVTGVETLKSMAVEPQMQRRYEEQLASYVASSFKVLTLNNNASQAVQTINKLVVAATLYVGARLVIDGDLTVGELVAFNMLSARVCAPVLRLAQMWQEFHQARLSIDRMGDILNTAPEPSFSPGRVALPAIRGEVTFEHVSFRYRIDGVTTLDDITFTVRPGEMIGIVGSSGSGKSTLAKLAQRLFVPEKGRVLVDGVDLAMVDVAWLRRQIGVVMQDATLFNRSIRDNIALADPSIPMDRVIAAASFAGAHDFILELPDGYDTIVGERGGSLSGGQRQRIAIARALVTDPRILILDEATSALDYESERVIQQNMKRIAAGRTVFVIAHRLSTVRNADRIITLENGRIVEDGSHEQLLRRGGRYASLHQMQAGI
ncbi:subfamily B ATP-binding cassette protein HlyB/CyaB [Rhodoblastus acidophilus]|uniref:type I secretion system permease/ATPase n=1 Tax=Rhodoblastus acidophilus TaxID=1074 RepID=UPI0022257012|nr:type I secretion system permease/ATPase [Rhodoblastus acidophilus]MCW2285375.1 subfamily B ATP-binding cassette protein HlyB/CyaB [Rhodoblastus acidophilus]MCW2334377.1 subfamily B ATP-binding cassette protein HlyB/CyaB [Rhodoblastus acidophilus]